MEKTITVKQKMEVFRKEKTIRITFTNMPEPLLSKKGADAFADMIQEAVQLCFSAT